ncbi:MAG: roadblock/LC7 domain-containing protein [Chloroflexota bacterium]|nr:roadblock/LC7 domain-containing protein [Chloroflexota bacterium]
MRMGLGLGLAMPPELIEQIEHILVDLHREAEAKCILLADVSGQLITTQGQMQEIDPVLVAALAAGHVGAMAELSRQVGEKDSGGTFLHEGKRRSLYLINVANSFIMIVIFEHTSLIGMVRLLADRAAEQLYALIAEFEKFMRQPSEIPDADIGDDLANDFGAALADDFGAALADELEKAFIEYDPEKG